MKVLHFVLMMTTGLICTTEKPMDLDFLEGTWKRENKELYEVWEKGENGLISGYGYKYKDGEKVITETLRITKTKNQFALEATVPDQNAGMTVAFILNPKVDTLLSFENPEHDFPKKIRYQKISDNQIKVWVLGQADEGFSYVQEKQ